MIAHLVYSMVIATYCCLVLFTSSSLEMSRGN